MKISLFETEQIEQYLFQSMPQGETVVFEARMLLDATLKNNVSAQLLTYGIIEKYGRKILKSEIVEVQNQFFKDPLNLTLREKLIRLFKN